MTITLARIEAAAATLDDLPPLTDLQTRALAAVISGADPEQLRDQLALRLLTIAGWPSEDQPLSSPTAVAALARSVARMDPGHPLLLALAGLPDGQVALWYSDTFWSQVQRLRSRRCLDSVRDRMFADLIDECGALSDEEVS